MVIKSKFVCGVLLLSTPLMFAQVKSDLSTTLVGSSRLSVRITNSWSLPVDALIVDGSIMGLPHIRGFYDVLYNFKHDIVAFPGKQIIIRIPVPSGAAANGAKFDVTCVVFQDGSTLGKSLCVDRIRRRREALLLSLTELEEILRKDKASGRTTSEIIHDIASLRLNKNQDTDASNGNDMAAAFGISNIQGWTKTVGDDPQVYTLKLLVICDEWRNNLIRHPPIRR
jgi:hypothetical protein